MDYSGKYIFIRFNPDKFKDAYGKNKNPCINSRLQVLDNVINKHINRIEQGEHVDLVEIHHIFYDEI